ncbi:RuvC-like resolvase [Streptomyces phage YDN12]|uniref:RuvC-like resolvase n=1 Tax=Streptomyces phage YDN12 TaxID=1636183 RepID=A0A0E3JJE3_9CAUD|nr:RuvC-like Holliday junction resolvase [Streptomyces phage YDN12]AKA61726.1 RuvC-like resolvase [Streptomyces phage YDN12]
MRAYRVVGLDLSLTSTGMSDGRQNWVTHTEPYQQMEGRLDRLVGRARLFVSGTTEWPQEADLVVIEAGAFSRNMQKGHEELAALRYMVRHSMWQLGVPFTLVSPSALKLYTAGHGKATKAQMVRAVAARHGVDLSSVMVKDGRYDMADAFALAAMGYAWANRPLVTVGPPPPRASLMSVPWPSAAHPDQTTEGI